MEVKRLMAFMIILSDTGQELVSFWNPRLRRRMFFIRDPKTKRFVRGIRYLIGCNICTFESATRKDPTKNLYVEAQACFTMDLYELRYQLLDDLAELEIYEYFDELGCEKEPCCDEFGVDCEIQGTEFYLNFPGEYCDYARVRIVEGKKEYFKRKTLWEIT